MNLPFLNNQSQADDVSLVLSKTPVDSLASHISTTDQILPVTTVVDSELPQELSATIQTPYLVTRDELFAKCPSLTGMLDVAWKNENAIGIDFGVIGLLAPYDSISMLIKDYKFSVSSVLIMFLPDSLEPFLLDGVSKMPRFNNKLTTDLLDSNFYLSWQFGPSHEVMVLESTLDSHLYHNFQYSGQGSKIDNKVLINVIFVAGKSAAIGSFIVDNDFMDDAQAQSCTARSHNAEFHFTETRMAEAALLEERVGAHPWYDGWYEWKQGSKIVAPWIQDFASEMYSTDSQRRREKRLRRNGVESNAV